MDAFITRKRPASAIETTDEHLPSPPSSALNEPSSPPAKKIKTASRPTANGSAKAPRTKKDFAKGKVSQELGHCSLNKKDFGDRIKECLALEKYEVQRMSIRVSTMRTTTKAHMLTVVRTADGDGRPILQIILRRQRTPD